MTEREQLARALAIAEAAVADMAAAFKAALAPG